MSCDSKKMYLASCTNTHCDVKDLVNLGWLKIKGLEYLETRAQFFYKIKKFLLCASDDTFLEVKRKDKHKDFSPMLHHDESPGKPQYNMAAPYF